MASSPLDPTTAGSGPAAENAHLQETLAFLQRAEAEAGLATWSYDLRVGRRWWSNQLFHWFGVDPASSALDNVTFIARVHPDDREQVQAALAQLARGGIPEPHEFRTDPAQLELRVLSPHYWSEKDPATGQVIKLYGALFDVTARKQAEAVLSASETKFNKAFWSSPDSIVISSLDDGRFFDVNASYLRDTGYSREEIIGRTAQEIQVWASETDRARLAEALRTQGQVRDLEAQYRRKSGEVRDALVSATLISVQPGRQHLLAVVRDITEARRGERLQEAVYRIAEAARTAGSGQAWYAEIHHCVRTVMPAGNFYIGVVDEGTGGLQMVYAAGPDTGSRAPAPDLDQDLAGQVCCTGQTVLRSTAEPAPGLLAPAAGLNWLGVPLLLEGRTLGVMAVGQAASAPAYSIREQRMLEFLATQVATVLHRNQVEAAARIAERRNSALLDNIPGGITLLDVNGRFVYGSPRIYEIFGYRPEEMLGQQALQWVHPEDAASLHEAFLALLAAPGLTVRREYRFKASDGTYRWVDGWFNNLLHEPGIQAVVNNFQDITERRLAEERLRASERRGHLLLRALPDLMFRLSRDGLILDYSAPAGGGLYAPPEAFLGHRVTEVLPGEVAGQCLSAIDQAFATGQLQTYEYQLEVAGQTRTFEARLDANRDEDEAVAIIRDITESRQRLAEVTQLSRAVEQMDDVLVITDVQGVITYVNPAFEAHLGYTRSEAVGKTPRMVKSGLEDAAFYDALWQTILRGDTFQAQFHNRHKDGRVVVEAKTIAPIRDDKGNITHFVATGKDITARQEVEKLQSTQFVVSRLLLEAPTLEQAAPQVIQSIAEGLEWQAGEVWLMDPDAGGLRRLARWNPALPAVEALYTVLPDGLVPAAGGLLGQVWSTGTPIWAEDLLSQGAPAAAPAQLQAEVQAAVHAVVAAPIRGESDIQGVLILYHGEARTLDSDLLAVLDSLGRQFGLYIARCQAEAALAEERNRLARRVEERTADLTQANAELARAARMKDEFLSSMSHELRTPLNGILSLVESLEEAVYGELTAQQLSPLHSVAEAGRHLLSLINDILDLSKVEAGKLELHLQPVTIDEVCQASLRLVRQPATQKRLRIAYTADSDLGTVLADEKRLKQMLVNLLGNAVKFTPAGGQIGLEVALAEQGDVVRFTVWDTGIGIPADKQALLFQPFSQIDSSLSRQYSGTGLGLSLVRRLAELHNGRVGLDSEPGRGSRFFVDLPCVLAEAELELPEGRSLQSALIVDDSDTSVEHLRRYLQELNCQVEVERRSDQALEHAARQQPDLIFLDLLMPDPSGWDVLAALKTDPRTRGLPVIIQSVVDERARGLKAGAVEYLVKPLTRDGLRLVVRRAMAAAPASRAAQVPVPTGDAEVRQDGSAPHVLVADDNPINQGAIRDFLRVKGYRVTLAGNGVEAVEQAQAEHPDLILMDIQMPVMDGLEAIRRLRAMPDQATTPIIALTALAMAGDRERCLEAGASEYMSKPLSLKKLAEMLLAFRKAAV